MPNINDAFPSKYLKATDLQGRQITVKMGHADYEMLGSERKLILYFQGKEKGMVLNKTNATTIGALYGPDTDNWHGEEITLIEAIVDYQGKSMPGLRVRAPSRKPSHNKIETSPKRMAEAENPADELDDAIPF